MSACFNGHRKEKCAILFRECQELVLITDLGNNRREAYISAAAKNKGGSEDR